MERHTIGGKRILLVEDEPSVRGAFSLMLSLDHHLVTEAGNGVEALGLFGEGRFDLVITDYAMPRMKGDELALNIRRLSPAQPILMITAYKKDLNDASNPVDAILSKPFELRDLRHTVSTLLARRASDLHPAN